MIFRKYHGAGNDFILLLADRATGQAPFDLTDHAFIQRLCDRHFGIGADGLIVLEPDADPAIAFTMRYFNADGRLGSLCGNGSRCAVRAAADAGWISGTEPEPITFRASDGLHQAAIRPDGLIRLSMHDVPAPGHLDLPADVQTSQERTFHLDTGSPHVVYLLPFGLRDTDVATEGRRIRCDARFAETGGVNVNFVERDFLGGAHLHIRTYERGVEAETLACGTGVTAAALVAAHHYGSSAPVTVQARGGKLQVEFTAQADGGFTNVALIGPAVFVFEGEVNG